MKITNLRASGGSAMATMTTLLVIAQGVAAKESIPCLLNVHRSYPQQPLRINQGMTNHLIATQVGISISDGYHSVVGVRVD